MISKNFVYDSGYISVDDVHEIYYEQYGNPNGKPILFLHGGPGSGCSIFQRKFFDEKIHRVIFIDQRGSGKSKPYSETTKNTTKDLLNDIEKIRILLKIEKWLIFGGSWGSTLAILYGINFPQNCLGFVLRGIFLGTLDEINWFLYGMEKFFPESYYKFINDVPISERNNILGWYHKMLHSKNKEKAYKVAAKWSQYEISCSTLKYEDRSNSSYDSLAIAKIESHYFINNCFIKDNFIIENIKNIENIPSIIIQGRHDVICPPFNALKLSNVWESSKIYIVEDGSHSAFEKEMFSKIRKSLEEIY